jgi:all-trans-8'-apo-beta-carotenal 15,15'-oxygenase
MPDFAPHLEAAFDLQLAEGEIDVEHVDGELPPWVRGTYYLNGPARFARSGTRCRHWLDGDGRVCAVRFGEGGLTAAARLVRTAKYLEEERAGHAVFRAFGTACGPNRLRRGLVTESPANVSVHAYRGALLAFGEQSRPYELDPRTLETRGVFDFAGELGELTPFSAHPRFDPATGEMFNFGVAFSPVDPRLHVYRFGPNGRQLAPRQLVKLPYPCSVHDFALGTRFAVFHISPYLLDSEGFLRRGQTTMESLSWQPDRGSQLLLVPRKRGGEVGAVPVGRGYCLHLINAFDNGNEVTVDLIEFDRPVYDQYQSLPELFADAPFGQPVRYVIDAANLRVIERRALDYNRSPDFPLTAPGASGAAYRDFWMLGISAAGVRGRKFFDQLVHGDWQRGTEVYQAPPGTYFAGQPGFVPPRDPGQPGALICPVFDAARSASSVAVFNAHEVAAGPLATARLGQSFHLGFHSCFVPLGQQLP